MKRFYEEPVVEITVFDRENIMTASTVDASQGTAQDHVNSINSNSAYATPGTEYAAADVYNSYGW